MTDEQPTSAAPAEVAGDAVVSIDPMDAAKAAVAKQPWAEGEGTTAESTPAGEGTVPVVEAQATTTTPPGVQSTTSPDEDAIKGHGDRGEVEVTMGSGSDANTAETPDSPHAWDAPIPPATPEEINEKMATMEAGAQPSVTPTTPAEVPPTTGNPVEVGPITKPPVEIAL